MPNSRNLLKGNNCRNVHQSQFLRQRGFISLTFEELGLITPPWRKSRPCKQATVEHNTDFCLHHSHPLAKVSCKIQTHERLQRRLIQWHHPTCTFLGHAPLPSNRTTVKGVKMKCRLLIRLWLWNLCLSPKRHSHKQIGSLHFIFHHLTAKCWSSPWQGAYPQNVHFVWWYIK